MVNHDYRVGDIVRSGDVWGVVRRVKFSTLVDWWTGQYSPGRVEEWITQRAYHAQEISAPFAHDYPGIPDPVIARSMRIILTEKL